MNVESLVASWGTGESEPPPDLCLLIAGLLLLAIALALPGCVVGPDGRRTLSPVGAAVLEDVLACGAPLLMGALSGSPDYIAASKCHLSRVGKRLGHELEAAPAPTEEHGRDVLRAAVLEHDGHHQEAKALAGECEATARARLGDEEGGR